MDERADTSSPETGSSQHVLPSGTVLGGRFRLLGALAVPGPHAVVYRAEGEGNEPLAVKELFPTALVSRFAGDRKLRPHDPASTARMADARRRFVLEAQLLESAEHPGLPRARAHLEANGTAYLVTELIDGRTLDQLLAGGGRLATADAGRIAVALLEALEVLHGQGILHRDVAPANVVLGADDRPRLLGLATPRQLLMYGMPGAVAPRAGFAAIEMYGSRGKGPWTDVHGVAALLYFMLTGTAPTSAVDRAAGEGLVPPSRLVAGIPWTVDSLVVKGLAQRPEERPHSAERFRALLEEALADSRVTVPGPFTPAVAHTPVGPLAAVPPAPASPSAVAVAPYAPAPAHQTTQLATPPTPAPGIPTPTLGNTALSFPAPGFGRLSDEDLREDEMFAGSNLAFDAVGGSLVLPREERSMTRLLRWGGGAAAALVVVVLAARALVGGTDRDTLEASSAPPRAVRPAPAAGAAQVDSVRLQGSATPAAAVTSPAPTAPTRTTARPTARPTESRETTRREPERRSEPEFRVDLSKVKVPVITAPLPGAKQPVPMETMVQLDDALSAAHTRAESGDYAGAQAALRTLGARIDDAGERYLSSSGLDAIRRRVDQERQRTKDACEALNTISRRRNGRILSCE